MNRTIKFRGLRTDGKGWTIGDLVQDHMNQSCQIVFWVSELIEPENNYYEMVQKSIQVIPETVGQFLFVDCNGKEVFTGDLCRDKLNHENTFEIDIEEFIPYAKGNSNMDRDLFELYTRNRIEVTGNIHQQEKLPTKNFQDYPPMK